MTLTESYETKYGQAWKALCRMERKKAAPPAQINDNSNDAIRKRVNDRRAAVKELHATGIMVKDIAAKLEWSLPTITEDLKQLRIQGEIV